MEHRRLGTTGVWVSELCLGTMMFGEWGTKDHDQSIRIIHRALDAGITFVDTADVYSAGESEIIVGKALAGRRDDIVLATKAFMPMSDSCQARALTEAPSTILDRRPPAAATPVQDHQNWLKEP
jgi:aryl-alcohol dehydrogenase-like predicted oxidoreductase